MAEHAPKLVVSVDDDPNILRLVKSFLKTYEVKTFSDPLQALEALQKGLLPDLIICDIDMPAMDGFALNKALRKSNHLQAVPFIFLTGLSDRQTFRKGMLQGADDYLTKPFTGKELNEAVQVRLERASLLRETETEGFRIVSMGGVSISYQGRMLPYEAKKVIELLLYLITAKEKPLRHIVPEMWWEAVVDNNLHVLVNRARKTFEGLVDFGVDRDNLSVRVLEPYFWDAEIFETAAKKALKAKDYAALEQSINLYKGTFLPSFDSPWTEQQRSYYEGLYEQLLNQSVDLAPNQTAQKSAKVRLQLFLDS
jgi:two-component SAPR family response regulator